MKTKQCLYCLVIIDIIYVQHQSFNISGIPALSSTVFICMIVKVPRSRHVPTFKTKWRFAIVLCLTIAAH